MITDSQWDKLLENGQYAWPGGYELGFVTDDGGLLCWDCANDPDNPVHRDGDADGWRLDGWVSADELDLGEMPEHCCNCNAEWPAA